MQAVPTESKRYAHTDLIGVMLLFVPEGPGFESPHSVGDMDESVRIVISGPMRDLGVAVGLCMCGN